MDTLACTAIDYVVGCRKSDEAVGGMSEVVSIFVANMHRSPRGKSWFG